MAGNLNIKNTNGKTLTIQNPDTNNADIVIDGSKIASTVSPTFTGAPTAPTQTAGDNSTKLATTAFVLNNGVPTGSVVSFAAVDAPKGYLKCNGALLSRTTYASLYDVIGTTFGAGDGSTTFALPDLRGYFPRGWDDGRGIDVGRVFGSKQEDSFKAHYHLQGDAHQNPVGRFGATPDIGASVNAQSSNATDAYNTSTVGGVETRPKNIALLYCIKY